jgi:diguanylate cyclase (GGDEF)-like protein
MDLDGFKQVNDNLGHHAGDLLLTTVADRLSTCVRESDTVARLGGDEFTIVLTETHKQEDVAMIAQKIIDAISVPFDLEGEQARIGISIGIARYSDEADNEDELMKHADQAMYQAKLGGKNTYRFASDH